MQERSTEEVRPNFLFPYLIIAFYVSHKHLIVSFVVLMILLWIVFLIDTYIQVVHLEFSFLVVLLKVVFFQIKPVEVTDEKNFVCGI